MMQQTFCVVAASSAMVMLTGCSESEDPPMLTVCNIYSNENSCGNNSPDECEWFKQGDNICKTTEGYVDYITENEDLCDEFDGYIGNACEQSCSDTTLTPVTWNDATASAGASDEKVGNAQGPGLVSFLIPSRADRTKPNDPNGFQRCEGKVKYANGKARFDDLEDGCTLDGLTFYQSGELTQEQFEAFLPLAASDVDKCRSNWCGVGVGMNGIAPMCLAPEEYCIAYQTQNPNDDSGAKYKCDTEEKGPNGRSDPLCELIQPTAPGGIFCQPAVPPCEQVTARDASSSCKVPYKDKFNKYFTAKYCKPNSTKQCNIAPLVQCTLYSDKCQAVVEANDAVTAAYNFGDNFDFSKVCTLSKSDGECAVEKIEGTQYV